MARSGSNSRITLLGQYPMTSAPTFGTDLTEVVNDIAPLIGESVENVGDLPSTGWSGRTVYVTATRGVYTRHPGGAWFPMSPQSCLAGLSGTVPSGQVADAETNGANAVSDATVATVGTNAIIVGRTGLYEISGQMNWLTSNSNGSRVSRVTRNNANLAPIVGDRRAGSGETYTSFSGKRRLTQGDVLRVSIVQDSGSTLAYSGQLELEWVHA
jgi:hypothetical protein